MSVTWDSNKFTFLSGWNKATKVWQKTARLWDFSSSIFKVIKISWKKFKKRFVAA